MVYIGIDPGLDGAVAALDGDGTLIWVWDTPTITVPKAKGHKRMYQPRLMAEILDSYREKYGELRITVGMELVNAMPGQGVTSMFSMGRGVGTWEGIVAALRLPIEYATPQSWKKVMLGTGVGKDKSLSILRAQQLVPASSQFLKLKKHDGRAEAILIAEYFRRKANSAA
jgi:hypothetical protein